MSDTVISVDQLCKSYWIKHQLQSGRKQGQQYERFSEVLTRAISAPFRRRKAEEVAASREEFWALKDVSFEVKRGDVLGVIGRNGAGKSTLLKVLSRITEPTTGRVEIDGRVASLLEVGTGFHPELTGRENVFLNGAILGMSRMEIKRKFDEIVAFAEVEKFLDTPVKRYSSGMYVRLAFSVAAHLEPEILIVDEVLAVGDAQFQKKCLGKMRDVSRNDGRTIIFVSHNLHVVQSLCSKGVLLAGGAVQALGPTSEVIAGYLKSLQSGFKIGVEHRQDRQGAGDIQFTEIEMLDQYGHRIENAISGQQLTLRLHYRTKADQPYRNCRVSVSAHANGVVYFLLSTELVRSDELVLQGRGHLDCIVPELPLSRGEYYLNPFVESNKVVQDLVEGAGQLSVVDGDFYGHGRNYPPGWEGIGVLVRHDWKW